MSLPSGQQDPEPSTTYRSVLADREFRVLLGTVVCYGVGFQLEILGLTVLVYARTSSPLLSALAFGIGFLPQLLGGALLTSLADRLPPRLVVTTGLVLRATPGLAIGLVPGLPVPALLALVAGAAVVSPVFLAATSGMLPDLLEGDRYVLGRSLLTISSSATQLLGLGMGGMLLAALAAPDLLLAAGILLVVSAAVARAGLRRRTARASTGPAPHRGGVLGATLTGNRRLLGDRRVRGLLLAQWLPVCFVTGAESLVVAYVGSLSRPASGAAVLLAALPVGMLVGDVVVGRWCRPGTREQLARPLAIVLGVPLLAFVLSPGLPLAWALLAGSGVCIGYQLGLQRAFLESLPKDLQGQGFGLRATGLMGGQGLLPPVAGAVAAVLGPGAAIAVAGGATLVAVTVLRKSFSPGDHGAR